MAVQSRPNVLVFIHCHSSNSSRSSAQNVCQILHRSRVRTVAKGCIQSKEVNAPIPASAHCTHCSLVAPATPSAPSTWPPRMMGRPPGRLIGATPSPMTVPVRECPEAGSDSSPLGRPDVAEAKAFPYEALSASASAPSIRWKATRRPSASAGDVKPLDKSGMFS